MASITVDLSEEDIQAAIVEWAVTRVLNEGRAVECRLSFYVSMEDHVVELSGASVTVETDRMSKPLPKYVRATQEGEDG